jgi:replicative DNA helicase
MSVAELPSPSTRAPQRDGGRVPPHNLEAEESLLGAMLLSREAIAAASDVHLDPADFYRPAHGHVFDAVLALYGAGEPVDPVTVSEELRRAGLLDMVGGSAALVGISARTPATSSAAHYARIVGEHALLRRLIGVAGEIAELGYSLPDDVVATVDRAESMVFQVAQRRDTDTTRLIKDLLDASLTRLEELYERGESITGLPTGYQGLDELLSGLQPSTLNIVGARPAMGKCVAGDTLLVDPRTGERITMRALVERGDVEVVTLDDDHQLTVRQPSAVIDDGIKPVFLVRLRTGREIRTTAAHPFLTCTGWKALADLTIGTRVAVPRELPIFGDEPVADVAALAARVGAARVDRGVPSATFRLPADQLATFLGLVLRDADLDAGARPEIVFHTASRAVAGDVQHLLVRFGINARLRRRRGPSGKHDWTLTIWHPEELRTFERRIGCPGREGELHLVGRRARVVLQQQHLDTEAPTERDEIRRVRTTPSTVGPRPKAHAHGRTAVYDDARLAIGTDSAIWWDEVVGIEPAGLEQVYDLTVPGEHNFVAADVFVHNTAFGLGMATHVAVREQKPVLFFSLEMGHHELTERVLSAEARVDSKKLRTGKLTEPEWSKISHAIGRVAEAPLYIDDNPHATVMEIRAKARRLKSKLGELGLVVIDYLQLMSGSQGSRPENRQVEVSEMSRGLKVLARELEIPVVALSQLNRGLELRADKRPMLADLRESGGLEQDADVVMFVYRDEVYHPDTNDKGQAEIIVAKHRSGPTGLDRLAFLNSYAKFENMARGM